MIITTIQPPFAVSVDAFRLKYFGDYFLSEVGFPLLCGSYMSPPRDKTACQTSPCKCKICIFSIESDVYNKKKIQILVVNLTFISSSEVKKCIYIFSLHSMK